MRGGQNTLHPFHIDGQADGRFLIGRDIGPTSRYRTARTFAIYRKSDRTMIAIPLPVQRIKRNRYIIIQSYDLLSKRC